MGWFVTKDGMTRCRLEHVHLLLSWWSIRFFVSNLWTDTYLMGTVIMTLMKLSRSCTTTISLVKIFKEGLWSPVPMLQKDCGYNEMFIEWLFIVMKVTPDNFLSICICPYYVTKQVGQFSFAKTTLQSQMSLCPSVLNRNLLHLFKADKMEVSSPNLKS